VSGIGFSTGEAAIPRLELPTRRRRWVLLMTASLLGGLVAFAVPQEHGTLGQILLIVLLAVLAGVSSLWSP
jgi:hypothetical protein